MKPVTPWMLVFLDRNKKLVEWNKGYKTEAEARKVMRKHVWAARMFVVERVVFDANY